MNNINHDYLKTIPGDNYKDILLQLDTDNLIAVCKTDKYADIICHSDDDYWWKARYIMDTLHGKMLSLI